MTAALIKRDDARLSVAWTQEAERLREEALELASIVGNVTSQEQKETAIAAELALKDLWNQCEKARKQCKEPVLTFGRIIDAKAKEFCAPLEAELDRISAKVRDYNAVVEQQRRAAEALRVKELAELERKRQEELAKAKTVEEIDRVQERFDEETKAAAPPLVVVRTQGEVIREDWEVTITDIGALWKAQPQCVRMEPRLVEIKQLLNAGVRPPGVEAKRVQTSGVRAGRRNEPLAIA